MSFFSRIPGEEELYVGGIWGLRRPEQLKEKSITHVLSVIKYSFDGWGEEANRFKHMSIDIDDVEESDLLVHFPSAVRFIEHAFYPATTGYVSEQGSNSGSEDEIRPAPSGSGAYESTNTTPGAVFVHCAMGKSRSVSSVIAWLLYKYPHRYGGKAIPPGTPLSSVAVSKRRQTANTAVWKALEWVRQARSIAEPNPGFMRQLELWWEMGCPANNDRAVENHPVYQKWLYDREVQDSIAAGSAPDWIRFEDEEVSKAQENGEELESSETRKATKEVRCKKCRKVLCTPQFIIEHRGGTTGSQGTPCPHIFVETLSWMKPALENGALDGRLNCPNPKCGANVGRFAWQGFKCSCREWICPAFSLNRSRTDEVEARRPGQHSDLAIRMPPGKKPSL